MPSEQAFSGLLGAQRPGIAESDAGRVVDVADEVAGIE
jgi:hypothetical protein